MYKCIQAYKDDFQDLCYGAARHAADLLGGALKKDDIKHVVTYRAKSPESLEKKLIEKRGVALAAADVVTVLSEKDIAGVRVGVYFPSDRTRVEAIVYDLFEDVTTVVHPKESDLSDDRRRPKRFDGYFAEHHLVHLRPAPPFTNPKTFMDLRVEVQVTSLLMHAWNEVEHDLVYKPGPQGDLYFDELAILDFINGLVISGEVAFDTLRQKLQLREVLSKPKTARFLKPLLEQTTTELRVYGVNLHSLSTDPEVETALFQKLQTDPRVTVHLTVSDGSSDATKQFLAYGGPHFYEHLKETVDKFSVWAERARRIGADDRLRLHVSDELKRETVFIADPARDTGMIILRRSLPGTRPEDRCEVTIPKARHPKTFATLWEEYQALRSSPLSSEIRN